MSGIENLLNGDSRALLDTINEKLPNSVWIIPADLKQNIKWISSPVSMQRGYSPEEVLGQSFEDIFTPKSLEAVMKTAMQERENEQDPDVDKNRLLVIELEMKCKDGSTMWTENQISFLHDDEGALTAFLGVTKDISEKKVAVERQDVAIKILQCLNEYEDVKETIDAIVNIIRENLQISSVSFRLLDDNGDFPHYVAEGFTRDFLDRSNSIIDHERESEAGCLCGAVVSEKLDDRFNDKTDKGSMWTGNLSDLKSHLEGNDFKLDSHCFEEGYRSLALIPIKTREKVIGLIQMASMREDIFDRKMIEFFEGIVSSIGLAIERNKAKQDLEAKEEQLRHAQRLQAVGRLAGGVAHDFNNLLTAINGYSDMLLEDVPESSKKDVMEIRKAGKRAAELTKQLLAFSRKQRLIKEAVDVNNMFLELQKMLLRLIKPNIDINFRASSEGLLVDADKSQLEQIMMNLVVNARDAMPDGGLINVSTQNTKVEKDIVLYNEVVEAGEYASIKVSDEGEGIPKENLDKIFEPFFTTKSVHNGSGLGLAMVYGIVRQHDGHIMVKSEEGEGTTFEVLLPLSKEKETRETKEYKATKESILSGRKVLVIEDDPLVLKVLKIMLEKRGAKVVAAINAEKAYEQYALGNGEFDIIVSDIVLPDGNGVEIVKDLKSKGFKGALLLTSGYTFDSDVHILTNGEKIPFIQKPFNVDNMIDKVSDLIKNSK